MGNMDMNEIDHFMPIMMRMEEDADTSPLVTSGSSHFLWIKHSNLYRILSKQEVRLSQLLSCSRDVSHNSQFTPSLHVLYLYISCYSELEGNAVNN